MPTEVLSAPTVSLADFQDAAKVVSSFAYHTPLLTSRLLSERTGFDVRLKAEMFQKGGSYKLRGPLNKFRHLTPEQRERGVICSSAGNHAQGVCAGSRRLQNEGRCCDGQQRYAIQSRRYARLRR